MSLALGFGFGKGLLWFFVLTHDVSHNKLFAHDLWVCETNETKMKCFVDEVDGPHDLCRT